MCVQNTRLHNPESGWGEVGKYQQRDREDKARLRRNETFLSASVGLNDLIFHEKNHDKGGRWSSNMIMSISCLETK